jgi:hypothetical protein
MNTETYRHLASASGKRADEHFRCMTSWVVGGKDAKLTPRCRSAADRYVKALQKELAYLLSRRQTDDAIAQRIRVVRDLMNIAIRDLATLTEH